MTSGDDRRVLVVDDDAEVRRLLGHVLRSRNITVDEAADGREAIALLSEQRYSVVLLDLLLPNVNGFEVLEHFGDGNASAIVLVITGADRRAIEQLDARRIHGIVRKPFDAEEIANVVASCAEIRGKSMFEAMAMAMIAGTPLLALLNRW
jgi:CheY-like chemotaxis protein